MDARRDAIRGLIAQGWPDAFMAHMKAVHTPSEEVGRIAQKAGVALAAFEMAAAEVSVSFHVTDHRLDG